MEIAIIPARGGSKRITRKNIKLFHGLPMIAYAIKLAQESKVFDDVLVSTDDKEIAEIAVNFGAKIPWMRPNELADDHATTLNVMQDAVIRLGPKLGTNDNVCCIYPATPLLEPSYLGQGLKIMKTGDWDYVISALRADTPPERFFSLGEAKEIQLHFPQNEFARTQDFQTSYRDAGQFYWGKKSSWESGNPIFSSKSTIIEIPNESAVDIDTLGDWNQAERLYELKKRYIP